MKLLEKHIQAAVYAALCYHPSVAWVERTNTGGAQYGGRGGRQYHVRFNPPGWSDITGMLKDGRFLAVEVKRPGEKQTAAQKAHEARVLKHGGIYLLVSDAADVGRLLPTVLDHSRRVSGGSGEE